MKRPNDIIQYIVHDTDGRIIKSGICPRHMAILQARRAGEQVKEGIGQDDTHEIKNGLIREKPPATP